MTKCAEPSVLCVDALTKSFGSAVNVLNGVSLVLARGEALVITGPSGSGKSTLLHLISGLDRPDSGRIRLSGQDAAQWGRSEWARERNRRIGMVFQEHHLLPQLTALENVLVPTLVADKRERARERAEMLLGQVGLSARAIRHRPGQLSGGERQRVAVVRALINEPALLLADEPTGALDHHTSQALMDLLLKINAERALALLVVTHSGEVAARFARQMVLCDGELRSPA